MFSKFYVFNPGTGKFLCWDRKWREFSGAKDFTTMMEARTVCANLDKDIVVFIFELHEANRVEHL